MDKYMYVRGIFYVYKKYEKKKFCILVIFLKKSIFIYCNFFDVFIEMFFVCLCIICFI